MYIIVAGVNTISERLVDELVSMHDVVVVEDDKKKAESLYSTGATVVNGSPQSLSVLMDAGISKADVLVSTLNSPNKNLVVSMIGKKYGVPKIVARVEDKSYLDIYNMLEVNTVEYTDIVYSEFLSVIEHPSMRKVANVGKDKEILEIVVSKKSVFENLRVDEIDDVKRIPKKGFKIVSVLREEESIVPEDTLRIKKGDSLIIVADKGVRERVNLVL